MKLSGIFMLLVALGLAQHSGPLASVMDSLDILLLDNTNGWRLEDHHSTTQHFLLFINDQPHEKYCYLIVISTSWEYLLGIEGNAHRIAEEIYNIIHDPGHRDIPLHPGDIADRFGDWTGAQECRGHDTYQMAYTPSFT